MGFYSAGSDESDCKKRVGCTSSRKWYYTMYTMCILCEFGFTN